MRLVLSTVLQLERVLTANSLAAKNNKLVFHCRKNQKRMTQDARRYRVYAVLTAVNLCYFSSFNSIVQEKYFVEIKSVWQVI